MRPRGVLLVLLLVFALAGTATAQETGPWLGTHYQPGNTAFSLAAGAGFAGGFGVSAYPGAEFIVTKFRPGDVLSVDIGAGVKGAFSFWNYSGGNYGYLSLGAAPFVSAHFGLRGFAGNEIAEYLDRLDFFSAIGLGYTMFVPTGDWAGLAEPQPGFGFANFSGVNIFLTDQIALTLSSNYISGYDAGFSAGFGVVYKIGPAEEIGERIDISGLGQMSGDLMYVNFAALYLTTIAMGGYMPSDDTFEDGDGIRFWHRYRDPEDTEDVEEMEFTRALLHTNDDGTKWWRFEFMVDDEELPFEALIGQEGGIRQLRYIDPATEGVVTYTPDDPYLWEDYEDDDFWTSEDLEDMRAGSERIRVPAGSFRTDRLEAEEEGYTYTWWLSDEVPGRVVKFEGESDDMENVQGELREIMTNVVTPWGVPW